VTNPPSDNIPWQGRFKELLSKAKEEFDRQDYLQAENTFQEALKLSPDDYFALANLGVVQFQLGKMNEAEVKNYEMELLREMKEDDHRVQCAILALVRRFRAGEALSAIADGAVDINLSEGRSGAIPEALTDALETSVNQEIKEQLDEDKKRVDQEHRETKEAEKLGNQETRAARKEVSKMTVVGERSSTSISGQKFGVKKPVAKGVSKRTLAFASIEETAALESDRPTFANDLCCPGRQEMLAKGVRYDVEKGEPIMETLGEWHDETKNLPGGPRTVLVVGGMEVLVIYYADTDFAAPGAMAKYFTARSTKRAQSAHGLLRFLAVGKVTVMFCQGLKKTGQSI
jgi:hypothetical protein